MPTVWGQRAGDTLRVYKLHQGAIEGLPEGERLRIKVEKDRNGKFNALFHLVLGKVAAAVNRGPATTDIDQLKRWIKIQTGRYDLIALPYRTPEGQTHAIDYHSTSFANMGEEEFHAFATDACCLIRDKLAPWIADAPEWREISDALASIQPEHTA